MKLTNKLRALRTTEGSVRGLGRAMTQKEVVEAIAAELPNGRGLSQSNLSLIEKGKRDLTSTNRTLLAQFFKVQPSYLVDDPEDFQTELRSEEILEDQIDLWLLSGADRFQKNDPDLSRSLRTVAQHADTRSCLLLLESIINTPALVARLTAVLDPGVPSDAVSQPSSRKKRKKS